MGGVYFPWDANEPLGEAFHILGRTMPVWIIMGWFGYGIFPKLLIIALICFFALYAPILILDEPTAGLDPIASEILKETIVAENVKGTLIMITSHLLSELDDLVTHVIFMQEGIVRFHSEINELRTLTGEAKISRSVAKILKEQAHG